MDLELLIYLQLSCIFHIAWGSNLTEEMLTFLSTVNERRLQDFTCKIIKDS